MDNCFPIRNYEKETLNDGNNNDSQLLQWLNRRQLRSINNRDFDKFLGRFN